jgi:hypothetical protein
MTSSGWDHPQTEVHQREQARRSRLASWIILGLLVMLIALVPAGYTDGPTLVAIVFGFLGVIIAAILNRAGLVTVAGSLLVVLVILGVMGAIFSAKGGLDTIYLPAYDLLAIGVIIGASILPRAASFVIAFVNVGVIGLDFAVQRHTGDLVTQIQISGPLGILARPIALQIIIGTVAYLWIRGTDEAIQRANRAEEVARLEHAVAEQRRQIEIAAQQLLETHVRAANGDYGARANITQDNLLWQVGVSLNNLLARLQKSGQAEHMLRRTDEELRRLAMAIDDAQAGRKPIWPAPTGTAADLILERITGRGQSQASAAPPQQGYAPPIMPPGMPSGMMPEQMPTTGGLNPDWGTYGGSAPTSDPRRGAAFSNPNQQQENPWFQPPEGQGW